MRYRHLHLISKDHISSVWATGWLAAVLCAGSALAQIPSVPAHLEIPAGLDLHMPIPLGNPLTEAKVALGRELFVDPRLSRDRAMACATCHNPARAFTDGRALSVGVFGRRGARSVPSLVNRGYGKSFFWDGRTTNLEEQVLRPIQDPNEMDMTLDEVMAGLRRDQRYTALFQTAFERLPNSDDLARALASYVRTILSGDSPVDRYIYGSGDGLSDRARQGLRLFRGKARCANCHFGHIFTDEGFHNTGVAWSDGEWLDDGRFGVTGEESDRGRFKTPTLREIARTAPYMHDGSITTLEDVVEFYDRGGSSNPYLDPEIRPLSLTEDEKLALLAFLGALSGDVREGIVR